MAPRQDNMCLKSPDGLGLQSEIHGNFHFNVLSLC